MNYEIIDCIDAGTEYCPCHLAESNECLLCSQLRGKTFCDCISWKGTCIFQEFFWNGKKAKKGRNYYCGYIQDKQIIDTNLIKLVIKTDHNLCKHLLKPGSFIFLRNPTTDSHFDVPISIMESNINNNLITVVLEIEGIKTKKIDTLNVNDKILIKGPFWNGILGVKHVNKCKESNAIIIARGIGQAPMIPVLKKLSMNNNKITVLIDKGKYNDIFVKKYFDIYKPDIINLNVFKDGNITENCKEVLDMIFTQKKIDLVHCSGPDILICKIMNYLDRRSPYSSCNNAKMCCGEGVCGACTTRFEGHVVKRLCKIQTDPEYIFEGRRLI